MNNRIDLTQFEGMTKGEWVYEEGEDGAAWLGTLLIPHIGAETPEHPHGTPYPVLSASGHGYHLTRSDIKAMAAVPELIAELKRMYEREDALVGAIKELRDSEDSTGCSEDLTVVRLTPMQILYELFPDTAYWGCACQGPHTGPC